MAEAFFNSTTTANITATSAGIKAREEHRVGKLLRDEGPTVTAAMRSFGIDVSAQVPKQLTPKMLGTADVIVWMAGKDTIPDTLKWDTRVRVWDVFDPRNSGLEETVRVARDIKRRVTRLQKDISAFMAELWR